MFLTKPLRTVNSRLFPVIPVIPSLVRKELYPGSWAQGGREEERGENSAQTSPSLPGVIFPGLFLPFLLFSMRIGSGCGNHRSPPVLTSEPGCAGGTVLTVLRGKERKRERAVLTVLHRKRERGGPGPRVREERTTMRRGESGKREKEETMRRRESGKKEEDYAQHAVPEGV